MNTFYKIVTLILMALISTLLRFGIAETIWDRVFVPMGAPSITWLQLLGFSFLVSAMTSDFGADRPKKESDLHPLFVRQAAAILGLLILWGLTVLIF